MLIALLFAQAAPAAPAPAQPQPPRPSTAIGAAPSAEAQALAVRVARAGSIMALLPLVAQKDTDALVADHPELSAGEKQKLRATAQATFDAGVARIESAFGRAYARRFTVPELRVLVTQLESPEQRRLRALQPPVMAEALSALGEVDLKKDTLAAFCRDTGKLCPAAPRIVK